MFTTNELAAASVVGPVSLPRKGGEGGVARSERKEELQRGMKERERERENGKGPRG